MMQREYHCNLRAPQRQRERGVTVLVLGGLGFAVAIAAQVIRLVSMGFVRQGLTDLFHVRLESLDLGGNALENSAAQFPGLRTWFCPGAQTNYCFVAMVGHVTSHD